MHAAALSALPPAIQVHLILALAALVLGPFALYARKGSPRHRWAGRLWVAAMLGVALSALFIRTADGRYGTRCSTVLVSARGRDGRRLTRVIERSVDADGRRSGEQRFELPDWPPACASSRAPIS